MNSEHDVFHVIVRSIFRKLRNPHGVLKSLRILITQCDELDDEFHDYLLVYIL